MGHRRAPRSNREGGHDTLSASDSMVSTAAAGAGGAARACMHGTVEMGATVADRRAPAIVQDGAGREC
jgi:shikimate 5-dehydrogenase